MSGKERFLMSLQFITGGSGSGKSSALFQWVSSEALRHPEKDYIVLVPDQFTLETQKNLVELSGRGGILNIDVLSFHRLAYRAFEEIPARRKTVLEDMGKMMLLRKVFGEEKNNLQYFRRGIYKPGFLDECKSFLCELMQYSVSEEDFDGMEDALGGQGLMALKLRDIRLIYRKLKEKMGDTYMMAEELVPQLAEVVSELSFLRGSVICLDGFTGFTKSQCELLRELMAVSEQMIVTVTTDRTGKRDGVFSISSDTIRKLAGMAAEERIPVLAPIVTGMGEEKAPYRTAGSGELGFLEKHIFSYGDATWKEPTRDITVHVCRRESEEAAYVARTIWRLKEEGYSCDEIAVVTGDMAAYEQPLSRELDRMGIPYFMDYKKSIGANVLAEYLLSFMEMYRRGMDYESTFRFLRCGLSPLTRQETDILENYVLARGRRGWRSYTQEWQYAVDRLDLVRVNEYRARFVESVRSATEALRGGKKTVEEFTRIFYQLMLDNQLYEKIQEKSERFLEEGQVLLSREYKSIYRLMVELMDELVALLGGETVTFKEYEELISAGISEGLLGFVPPAAGQVMVGDVERSRLDHVKVLFFMGVSDDRIPKSQGTPGILSEREREMIAASGIELAPSPEELSNREQFYLYLALTKPSEKLILTYGKLDGNGMGKRPSYLIRRLHQIFPEMKIEEEEKMAPSPEQILGTDQGVGYMIRHLADGTFRQDRAWWELAAYHERKRPGFLRGLLEDRENSRNTSRISEEAAALLYGREIFGSVTRLEQFAKCPYAHFIIFGLGLSQREEFRVEAYDYGNVFHRSLEHFSHMLEEQQKTWQDLTEEEIFSMTEECVDRALEYKDQMFYQTRRVSYMAVRMKRIMGRSVWAMWKQMKEGNFEARYSEKQFPGRENLETAHIPLDGDKSMIITGKIDRVDTCDSGGKRLVKILDYKSGSNDLALDRIYYGLQMQLVAYMTAALEIEEKHSPGTEAVPAAMLYYRLQEPELEWKSESGKEREDRLLKEMKCTGFANDDPVILEKLDHNLAGGGAVYPGASSAVVPVSVNKKDGKFSKNSHVLSTDEFGELMDHTRKKMKEFGNRIYQGEIQAEPYAMKAESGCDYCDLKGICGVEARDRARYAKEYPAMREEEVWEVLHGKNPVDK